MPETIKRTTATSCPAHLASLQDAWGRAPSLPGLKPFAIHLAALQVETSMLSYLPHYAKEPIKPSLKENQDNS
jgi:hypothetical protein